LIPDCGDTDQNAHSFLLQLRSETGIYAVSAAYSLIAAVDNVSGSHGRNTLVPTIRTDRSIGKNNKMPAERTPSLQDTFLNHVRKQKVPLTIFLINGVKLQGIVTWFDSFCVLLRRDGHSQLVYKHAVSTIMPGAPVNLMDGEGGDEG
jgi:host factor-I protein